MMIRLRKIGTGWIVLLVSVLVCLTACSPNARERPPGYIRLLPVWELTKPETIFERSAFIVRYDEGGFSAMSTLSTYDLGRLQRVQTANGWQWVSRDGQTVFADDGSVVSGPAKEPLPYYDITIDRGGVSSQGADTLYVRVGTRRPPSWRFKAPSELLRNPSMGRSAQPSAGLPTGTSSTPTP